MISVLITALAGMAAASPTMIPNDRFPLKYSQGFRLVVNMTNPTDKFTLPINGLKLAPFRAGANINTASLSEKGAVFFITDKNITRLSTDYMPTGLAMRHIATDPPHFNYLGIDGGQGTPGFVVSSWPNSCGSLFGSVSGTFAVCDTGFEAPRHPRLAVHYVEGAANANRADYYAPEPNVPAHCVAVKLLPECAPLEGQKMGEGEEVVTSRCYEDVKAIDWQNKQVLCG